MVKAQMDELVNGLNSLNPWLDFEPITYAEIEYDIIMSYKLSCTEE